MCVPVQTIVMKNTMIFLMDLSVTYVLINMPTEYEVRHVEMVHQYRKLRKITLERSEDHCIQIPIHNIIINTTYIIACITSIICTVIYQNRTRLQHDSPFNNITENGRIKCVNKKYNELNNINTSSLLPSSRVASRG